MLPFVPMSSDFSSDSAPIRWEAGAERFHGNRQPASDAALAHHLQSVIITQQAAGLLIIAVCWSGKTNVAEMGHDEKSLLSQRII